MKYTRHKNLFDRFDEQLNLGVSPALAATMVILGTVAAFGITIAILTN